MEIEQKHMDAYTSGSTKDGVLNWEKREDRDGIQAVLKVVDPAPKSATVLIDADGMRWERSEVDPMIWHEGEAAATAASIIERWGFGEWQ